VVCTALLQDLLARGLTLEGRVLWVIDGGKGLRKSLGDVFGDAAVIQRCQLHKGPNLDALVSREGVPISESVIADHQLPRERPHWNGSRSADASVAAVAPSATPECSPARGHRVGLGPGGRTRRSRPDHAAGRRAG
jgi:Transposase, Mutator family